MLVIKHSGKVRYSAYDRYAINLMLLFGRIIVQKTDRQQIDLGRLLKLAHHQSAGIPRELTHQSRRAIADKRRETAANKGFELWEYNHAGQQLFPNRYSGQNLGLRFLFVDRLGTGSWSLESTNAVNIGS